jgi:hypothetical protein
MEHQHQELCVFWLWKSNENGKKFKSEYPAVTLSISKVKGADAMKISEQILEK